MENKKNFYFLAGLPRSGSTLLAALLNQHPDVYVSPNSPVAELLYVNHSLLYTEEYLLLSHNNRVRFKAFLTNFFKTYYQDVEKPTIIDRCKVWGTPYNLNLLEKDLGIKPKIILTVRDILEVLASFVVLDNPSHRQDIDNLQYYVSRYKNYNDILCDHLMRLNGEIDKCLLSISMVLKKEYEGMFYLLEYDDLMNDTQNVLNQIYDFLELPHFTNDLNNIRKIEIDSDIAVGLNPNTHSIRKTIKPSTTDPKKILSEYVYNKYSGLEFWRNK